MDASLNIRWASDGFTPVENRKEAVGSKTVSEVLQDFSGYLSNSRKGPKEDENMLRWGEKMKPQF
jgi:hypothetical protein